MTKQKESNFFGLIYIYCQMIITIGSANICHLIYIQYKERKIFSSCGKSSYAYILNS